MAAATMDEPDLEPERDDSRDIKADNMRQFEEMDEGELKTSIQAMQQQLADAVKLNDDLRKKIVEKEKRTRRHNRKEIKRNKNSNKAADQAKIHESENTVHWLEDLERLHYAELPNPDEDIQFVWALEFNLPADNGMDIKHGERRIPHEAWALCERFWACDLHVHHTISSDARKLIVMVGAPYTILVREAHEMKIIMRLQNTKGSLAFHEDKIEYYATNHGGLNEYRDGQWIPRLLEAPVDIAAEVRSATKNPLAGAAEDMGAPDEEHKKPALVAEKRVFTSSLQQRLVVHRMNRVGHVNLAMRMHYRQPLVLIKIMEKHVKQLKPVRGTQIHELLTVTGAYRPGADQVFPPNHDGQPAVYNLSQLAMADPMFVVDSKIPMKQTQKMSILGTNTMSYDEVIDAVQILKEWCDQTLGPGREERFQGTLRKFFPIHDEDELYFLRQQWGNFHLLFRGVITGYNTESKITTAFGSPGNELCDHVLPLSWHYQPIDEIRDYFGDDVGLYFSWLGKYTEALFLCSLFGVVTMVFQPIYGGVDNNPLTVAYSIYVGLWSIAFLESWQRRENELRFLWGAENLTSTMEPLPQFKGVLRVNVETGKEDIVYANKCRRLLRVTWSYITIVVMMILTVSCALAAMMLHVVHPAPAEGTIWVKYKWQIVSSGLNLFIIVVFGAIYEVIAYRLNKWENHRTEQEFENALTVKNFIFQFFNNYFVLFYIVYLREVEDPFEGKSMPCAGTSCLGELQIQLLIVFSGKTIGKQIFFTIKPFLYKFLNTVFMVLRLNAILKKAAALGKPLKDLLPTQAADLIDAASQHLEDQKISAQAQEDYENQVASNEEEKVAHEAEAVKPGQKKTTRIKVNRSMVLGHGDEFEIQTKLLAYDGTFDDFNDRAIQFGYLVLFAPAFPLAPFFAFINNVIEIRGSGFKLCHGYQRPPWKARDSIGSWFTVLNILGFTAVVTNASMVAFVGSQMAHSNGLAHAENFSQRVQESTLFWRFVAFEHSVILLRFIVIAISPSNPTWIQTARETLEFRMRHVFKTRSEIEMEVKAEEEFRMKMDRHKETFAKMTLDELQSKFNELDADNSKTISRLECIEMFKWIDPNMDETEKERAFAILDPDNSGDITFDEFKSFVNDDTMDTLHGGGKHT